MKRRSVVDRLRHVIWLSALLTHVSITFAVAQPHEILHHFQNPLYNPSGVVEDSDGSLYGTFDSGGPGNGGGLFRVAPDGTFTVVHAFKFQVSSDPRHPRGGLAKGPDGAFYGATLSGGTNGNGTLFRWDRTTLTILHSFIGSDSGFREPVIVGTDGVLYGTRRFGGGCGSLYKFDAGVFTTLYTFPCSGTGGRSPRGRLYRDAQGTLFGTTESGGTSGLGTIYKWTSSGLTTLHSFTSLQGRQPQDGVIEGLDGAFYGTTSGGSTGRGTLFRFANGTLTTLYTFVQPVDGSFLPAGLVQGSDGALYGTTRAGGTGYGVVFKWHNGVFSRLHAFDWADGAYPGVRLILDARGRLVGSTESGGGPSSYGTVFVIATDGGEFTVLSRLTGQQPRSPSGNVVRLADGTIYGVTGSGGTYEYGALYRRDAGGTLTTLHSFSWTDGAWPQGGLIRGVDGALYGSTSGGGSGACGTLFKWDGAALQTLHSFDCAGGEMGPIGTLLQAADGSLYGTTAGDLYYYFTPGALFRFDGATFTTLHTFDWTTGWGPSGGLVQGAEGAVYGATTDGGDYGAGTIFKWHEGNLSVVRSFDWSRDGGYPYSPLVQAADGSIFGTAYYGGAIGFGTLFKLIGTTFSVVHNFSASDAGGYPYGSLARLADGTIVGSAQGATFYGSLFKWKGALTSIITFDPAQENGYWPSGLTVASDGNVHGATFSGGAGGGGTLFRLVFNIPPSITDVTGPAAPVAVNVPALVTTTYTDDQPSGETCTFAWGDGQPNTTVAGNSGTCSAAHPFIDAGVYTVTVTVTDAFGLSDTDTSAYVVVYDPSAGFVTGGGWIQSPSGAYTADATLQGHANFGFVAKYQKGTTVPRGETAFRFEIGVLDFASVSYEWLIISGARAQYKGVGTVNDVGDYGFLLTAVDGQVTGGGGADRFRIKIWDRASGAIIYDNGMGTAETSNGADAEAIKGSIVIHVK